MFSKIKLEAAEIFDEHKKGNTFKASIGDKGIFEQTKINERFFIGDQWHGVQAGNQRPLTRRNLIKRIGEYKMSAIGSAPLAVNYSADGVPNTADLEKEVKNIKDNIMANQIPSGQANPPEVAVIMQAMSEYFATTAERLKFDIKKEELLRNAYISGTGIAYTYWDSDIETGLYVDEARTTQIKGDIALEVLDVENVVFGDPNNDDVQSQPFIIISQRLDVEAVRREAKKNGASKEEIEKIIPDNANSYDNSSSSADSEPTESRRVTVLTKLYKKYNEEGKGYKVCGIRVTEKAIVRREWDLKIRNYPLAKFCWERRRGNAYGESEITYIIPNQIAINRASTSAVWATMLKGMPKMIVNGDVVTEAVTNDPGEIIRVYGDSDSIREAIHYVTPPDFTRSYQNLINDLANNTLSDSGANDAALGNMRPDNAAAIIQMREAAMAPMQMYQNRFYSFIEDIARIWADFWINLYGNRSLKINDKNETYYLPFKAERYKNLIITSKVDVGASTLWSESVVIATLDALLSKGLITFEQYLERIPKGLIPDITGLLNEAKKTASAEDDFKNDVLQKWAQQNPREFEAFKALPPEQQQQMLQQILQGGEI